MMFTTELSHRVFLTVLLLLLGVIGKRPEQVLAETTKTPWSEDNDKTRESEEQQGLFSRTILANSNANPKSASFYDNYHSYDHDTDLRSSSSLSSSKSITRIRNNPSHSSSPSVMIKTHLPFTINRNDFQSNTIKDYSQRNGNGAMVGAATATRYPNNGNFFDCFFEKNCPMENDKDEWRNYYSVLNGLEKPGLNDRYMHTLPFGSAGPPSDIQTGLSAAIPFIVDGRDSNYEKVKGNAGYNQRRGENAYHRYSPSTSNLSGRPHIRFPRTTTSSPSWVKLQPLPGHMYDPFPTNKNKSGEGVKNSDSSQSQSQFASRIGQEEMSPETFADRYGWTRDGPQSGLRMPAWLEELNNQHGFRGQDQGGPPKSNGPGFGSYNGGGPGLSDDNKGWVKLDPIPVSGVTISKWVPKGTSPQELPSTNWPVRDKPNAWWDRIDIGIGKPESSSSWNDGPIRSPLHSSAAGTWGAHRSPVGNKKHQGQVGPSSQTLSDAWSDVIYPDTPVSATASWEASKGGTSSSSSSFPASWNSNGGGDNKYSGRPPVASWSAPGSGSNKANAGRFGNQRPTSSSSTFGRPSYYPDPQAGPNDSRWVLVSTTGETSVKNPPYKVNNEDHFSDFPSHYDFHSHRHSKDMNLTKLLSSSSSAVLTPEELFRRTNETLHSLAPVIKHRVGAVTENPDSTGFRTFVPLLEDAAVDYVLENSSKIQTQMQTDWPPKMSTQIGAQHSNPRNQKTFLQRINPVFAAVGAGMIPAALAAVVPAALGRRRKRDTNYANNNNNNKKRIIPRLVFTHRQISPILLSSSAPNLYKFLRKPVIQNSWYR